MINDLPIQYQTVKRLPVIKTPQKTHPRDNTVPPPPSHQLNNPAYRTPKLHHGLYSGSYPPAGTIIGRE
jgi:hypothetical protein